MTTKEKVMMYDALLSTPWMSDNAKLPGSVSRKLVLLFGMVIEKELKEQSEIFSYFPKEMAAELEAFVKECMEKAGLKEFYSKSKGIK